MDSNIYNEILPIYQSGKISWQEIADRYGFSSKDAARSQFKRERKKRGDAPVSAVEHEEELEERERTTYTESEDSIHVVCDSKRIRTRNDVIEFFNIDETVWEVKEFTVKTSEGYRKDRKVSWQVRDQKVTNGDVEDSGKILIVPMMHTETKFVKKNINKVTLENVDKLFSDLNGRTITPNIVSYIRQYKQGGLVLEIDFADGHIGNEALTFEQVTKRMTYVIEEIKRRTKGLVLEKIVLAQMGDIFHMDTYNRTTTSGTQMTYGMSPNTMFDKGIELMVWMITELSAISKVEVVNLYGNHDKLTSYTLSKVIETYFRNDDNVEIDATQGVIKFRKFGISSVGFVHGDMPKNNIYDTFQKEGRKLFGETVYSEIHVAHLHHEIALEKGGVITRWVPSITSPDEYHVNNGYTGAKQGVQCFLWDLENGLESIWMIPVGNIN